MPPGRSPGEREYATLVAELRALERDVDTARATAARSASLDLHHDTHHPPHGEPMRLPDGTPVLLRSVEPGDRAALASAFAHLSAMSRFRAMRGPADRLTHEQLTELTNVDHVSCEALVALDAATGEGVGMARYARDPRDPGLAELTCAVADPWQRRGVGSALIERLAVCAREAGIERFAARIVVGDDPPRRLLARVADELSERRDGGTIEIIYQRRD